VSRFFIILAYLCKILHSMGVGVTLRMLLALKLCLLSSLAAAVDNGSW
jgi:hypothetical protein